MLLLLVLFLGILSSKFSGCFAGRSTMFRLGKKLEIMLLLCGKCIMTKKNVSIQNAVFLLKTISVFLCTISVQ